MSELSTIVVEARHYSGGDLDLSGTAWWGFALDQRAFGPRQVIVITASGDGVVLGLAHCPPTERPELALTCCLAALADGAAVAVAYSDEPVSAIPPIGLRDRLDTARAAARPFGVHLVDWIMCDDDHIQSMSITLQEGDHWWDAPHPGPPRRHRRPQPTRATTRPTGPDAPDDNRAAGDNSGHAKGE